MYAVAEAREASVCDEAQDQGLLAWVLEKGSTLSEEVHGHDMVLASKQLLVQAASACWWLGKE